jgi:hypothetical protein
MPHITLAGSERATRRIFEKFRDEFHEETKGSKDLGAFTVAWELGVRLAEGRLDFESDGGGGRIKINELDVVYDPLKLTFGLDIPKVCIGGFCIIPSPFGCILRAPRFCLFESDPDVSFTLDLSGLIESEISGGFRLKPRYDIDEDRTPSMTDLDAEDAGVPNKWNLYLDPIWLDIDLIDISDTVGNILDKIIDTVVDGLLGWLPGWARDLIKAILGSLSALIRKLLDIADDIDEWLSNLLGVSLGIFDLILQIVGEFFADKTPIFGLEDPYPIMDYSPPIPLIPVKIPIRDLGVVIRDTEFHISANVGS